MSTLDLMELPEKRDQLHEILDFRCPACGQLSRHSFPAIVINWDPLAPVIVIVSAGRGPSQPVLDDDEFNSLLEIELAAIAQALEGNGRGDILDISPIYAIPEVFEEASPELIRSLLDPDGSPPLTSDEVQTFASLVRASLVERFELLASQRIAAATEDNLQLLVSDFPWEDDAFTQAIVERLSAVRTDHETRDAMAAFVRSLKDYPTSPSKCISLLLHYRRTFGQFLGQDSLLTLGQRAMSDAFPREERIEACNVGISIAESVGNPIAIAHLSNTLFRLIVDDKIESRVGREQLLSLLRNGLAASREGDDPETIAWLSGQLAALLSQIHDHFGSDLSLTMLKEAVVLGTEALQISEPSGEVGYIAYLRSNRSLALVHLARRTEDASMKAKLLANALKDVDAAISIRGQVGNDEDLAYSLNHRAILKSTLARGQERDDYLLEAISDHEAAARLAEGLPNGKGLLQAATVDLADFELFAHTRGISAPISTTWSERSLSRLGDILAKDSPSSASLQLRALLIAISWSDLGFNLAEPITLYERALELLDPATLC